uniref:Zinc finger protein 36 family 3 protein n=1 Tax=Toxoplasma gondii TgCATBr9 TaxID=943120 RepID=A0A2T6IIC4_TOXGO|nr:zinc finger protein 36 family 3 protein [Toxoplasma gondii TgCATBr9]
MESLGSRQRSASAGARRNFECMPSRLPGGSRCSDDVDDTRDEAGVCGLRHAVETSSFVTHGMPPTASRGFSPLSSLLSKEPNGRGVRGRKLRGSTSDRSGENEKGTENGEMAGALSRREAPRAGGCTPGGHGDGEAPSADHRRKLSLLRFLPFAPQHFRLFLVSYFCYAVLYSTRKPFSVVKEDVHRNLGLSTYSLGCIDTSFLALYAVGQFVLPPALARLRLSLGLSACYLISAGATLAFGLSSSPAFLVGWWGLNGIAHAAVFPLLVKALTECLSQTERGRAMGLWTTSQQTGAIASTAFAAFVASRVGWRAVFLLSALICGLATFVLCFCLPSSASRVVPTSTELSSSVSRRTVSKRQKQGFSLLQAEPGADEFGASEDAPPVALVRSQSTHATPPAVAAPAHPPPSLKGERVCRSGSEASSFTEATEAAGCRGAPSALDASSPAGETADGVSRVISPSLSPSFVSQLDAGPTTPPAVPQPLTAHSSSSDEEELSEESDPRSRPSDLFRQSGGTGDSLVVEFEDWTAGAPAQASTHAEKTHAASLLDGVSSVSSPSALSGLELSVSVPHMRVKKLRDASRQEASSEEETGTACSVGAAGGKDAQASPRSASPSKARRRCMHAEKKASPRRPAELSFLSIVWNVPFVLSCSCAYFVIKLIRYSLLFWLPFFLAKEARMHAATAGYASMIFDIGGIGGAVAGGFLADRVMKGRRLTCATTMSLLTGFSLLLLAFACQQQQTLLRRLEEESLLQAHELQHLRESHQATLASFHEQQKKTRLQLPLRLQQTLEKEANRKKQETEEEEREAKREEQQRTGSDDIGELRGDATPRKTETRNERRGEEQGEREKQESVGGGENRGGERLREKEATPVSSDANDRGSLHPSSDQSPVASDTKGEAVLGHETGKTESEDSPHYPSSPHVPLTPAVTPLVYPQLSPLDSKTPATLDGQEGTAQTQAAVQPESRSSVPVPSLPPASGPPTLPVPSLPPRPSLSPPLSPPPSLSPSPPVYASLSPSPAASPSVVQAGDEAARSRTAVDPSPSIGPDKRVDCLSLQCLRAPPLQMLIFPSSRLKSDLLSPSCPSHPLNLPFLL